MSLKNFFNAVSRCKELEAEIEQLKKENAEKSATIETMNKNALEFQKSRDGQIAAEVKRVTAVMSKEKDELQKRLDAASKEANDLRLQIDAQVVTPAAQNDVFREELVRIVALLKDVNRTRATKAQAALYDAIDKVSKKL